MNRNDRRRLTAKADKHAARIRNATKRHNARLRYLRNKAADRVALIEVAAATA